MQQSPIICVNASKSIGRRAREEPSLVSNISATIFLL